MKNYIYDSVDCDDSSVGYIINKLQGEGWKEVSFCNGGDFNNDHIQGYRPMTKKEIKEVEKRVKQDQKEEVRDLFKLAKKHKYKLVKLTPHKHKR